MISDACLQEACQNLPEDQSKAQSSRIRKSVLLKQSISSSISGSSVRADFCTCLPRLWSALLFRPLSRPDSFAISLASPAMNTSDLRENMLPKELLSFLPAQIGSLTSRTLTLGCAQQIGLPGSFLVKFIFFSYGSCSFESNRATLLDNRLAQSRFLRGSLCVCNNAS